MVNLRSYIEANTIRRLTEQQQDDLALMVDRGDEQGLLEWCGINDVTVGTVKKWARTGILAAGMAVASSEPLLAEDDIPAVIRSMANQTEFAKAAQKAVPSGRKPSQPVTAHWNQQQGMLWDPIENIWVPRGGRHREATLRFDPYLEARQMHARLIPVGYNEDLTMPSTGGPGVVPPDPPPPPGASVNIDSSPDGDPGEEVNEPAPDVPSKTIMYNFNGQRVAFQPFPTPIELARARQRGAFFTEVPLKNQPTPAPALMYEENGVRHVLLLPRN